MKMPKVSVLMPVYNEVRFLREAVQSILAQTFLNFEFIIVDDGSKSKTREILSSFKDPRLKIFFEDHRGLCETLNKGIKEAQGEYIARMDADDIALPGRLEEQVSFLESHPRVALCGTWVSLINEMGEKIREHRLPVLHKDIARMLLFHNPFFHPTVMWRKEVTEKVGAYNPRYKYVEDYELWMRAAKQFTMANIPKPLLEYRITSSGVTRSKSVLMRTQGVRARLRHLPFLVRMALLPR